MFNIKKFVYYRCSRTLAGILITTGICLLIFAFVFGLTVSGKIAGIFSSITECLHILNRKLGGDSGNDSRVYWYISRAAGITAYLILSFAVLLGLTISNKLIKKLEKRPLIYEMHNILAIASLLAGLLHAFILIGDDYIQFTWASLLIPFASPYRPLWVGIGVITFYAMILTVLSFYMRSLITYRGWRIWHYTTFLTWIAVVIHGFKSGTDTNTLLMRTVYSLTVLLVIILVLIRILKVIRQKSGKHPSKRYSRVDDL